ncbi:hypothetical protein LQ772_09295 [Frateuria edaphi]|jgi:hypothetical protein|uniref:hypothetical protein n=1 Tax=Frateuria TaxID=70411 RepID=UPI001E2FC126|nr:hypothetical protein [Frateuria edaphi]UGB44199.1 hypothetical protein LQ772_09295 [Frateuria edaphi]
MNTPQDSSYRPSAGGKVTDPGVAGGAEDMAEKVRAEGQEQVQHYRNVAADKVDTLADSVKAAAAEMRDDDVAHLSRHVSDMASGLGRMADGLREKSADEILHDVRRIARENPTLFIAGSIAIGFGLTRFARASASNGADRGRSSNLATSERTSRARWTDADAAVPGTAAHPATGNDTIDTTAPGGLTGSIPAVPGPSASTADAISARAGAAASDTTDDGRDSLSSTDTLRGRNQP